MITPEAMSTFSWNSIGSWAEGERYIIYSFKGSYNIIDKQGFEQEDFVRFDALIEEVLEIKRDRLV